ncbi:Arm DNA-binding domain-containing protein [Paenibacillus alvei]|uniref:Arm DNA-binding domain-containing protein n=1 Tax=Paenibacillus alvei TaxID=44250 RepID=UPI003D2A7A8A
MEDYVYQRGNTWTYVIELPPDPLTGKRKQKSKGGFKTEEEAELAKLEKIIEIKKGLYKPDSKMTVAEYLDFWLDNSKVKHRLTTYITNRELITKRIIPVLGDIKLINLTADHIEKFLVELSK